MKNLVGIVLLLGCCGVMPMADLSGEEKPVADHVKVDGKRVWIEDIKGYAIPEPLFEGACVVARHLGAKQSPAYLQGISGAAFRIAGICPCAPTCSAAMDTTAFAERLGYKVTQIEMGKTCKDWPQLQHLAEAYQKNGKVIPDPATLEDVELKEQAKRVLEIIERVKAGIRSGTPVVVWHAFTNAEYDVVTGYDDATGEFLGRGGYNNPKDGGYAHAPQGRMVETAFIGGLPNAILLSGPAAGFDARAAEIAALKEAVKHGRSQENVDKLGGEKWVMLQGIACYDRWVKDWARPEKKRELGDAYCFGVYSKTHAMAAGFLSEIAPKYEKAKADLERAAQCFQAEAEVLEQGRDLLWWSAPEGPDAERNKKATELLTKARDHYAAGIAAIEKALGNLE